MSLALFQKAPSKYFSLFLVIVLVLILYAWNSGIISMLNKFEIIIIKESIISKKVKDYSARLLNEFKFDTSASIQRHKQRNNTASKKMKQYNTRLLNELEFNKSESIQPSSMISKKMKQYNVIFAATCRKVEHILQNTLDNIALCGKKFNDYLVIIYENDSSDRTREVLHYNKMNNPSRYHYIFESNITEGRRTKRITRGRNLILNKVREINKDNHYQYLIVLDVDRVNSKGTFVDTIDSCFATDGWDMMSANQKGFYYDLWALRNKDLDYDCWNEDLLAGRLSCPEINIKYPSPGAPIEVNSAFGGGAIYNLSSIPEECQYNGFENGREKCEHVDFNLCIKKHGGKLYINPDFLNDAREGKHR
jgi:hypothetical protein